MTNVSNLSQRVFAALGAVAITASLLVSSFATPNSLTVLGAIA